MFAVNRTIISQYATAPILNALVLSWNAAIDPAQFIQGFVQYWWNINTAIGAGLDNLGAILGVKRSVVLPGSSGAAYLMIDSVYRPVLLAKALANISRTSIQELNAIAQQAFGDEPPIMFCADLGNMQMAYVFSVVPTLLQQAIAQNSGVLPTPTGVALSHYTAILNNAQLVAAGTTEIGYVSGISGSLTPSVDINGNTVTAAYYEPSGPEFVLSIQSSTTLVQTYLNWLSLNGFPLLASAATFSSSSGVYTWTWSGTVPEIVATDTCTLLLM